MPIVVTATTALLWANGDTEMSKEVIGNIPLLSHSYQPLF